ncbi:CCR4-Not complex component, Not1-domain-containing protein [Thamnocephalis sphaerospora]|uniref:General negative regulator of transcription subunit 1 n=1 Tax=Thamnocephalis sphaerospora TaxID=78915 RepID=A0A4P9XWG5_9FUNG|nr:CCR4-Not complex component, Not1-domain-containing protein [Thamnocephalis sphaerospora]|eukprot:RKP10666.1 CCR4-Not complex component, Not1-domain-containing protein [Thamnocephalis sphaerospora]
MLDLGYKCCSSPAAVHEVLAQYGVGDASPLSAEEVARVLGMMVRTHVSLEASSGPDGTLAKTWNSQMFASVIAEKQPDLDWEEVLKQLDYPEFTVFDLEGMMLIVSAYRAAIKETRPLPASVLLREWTNKRGHYSLFKHAIFCSPDLADFSTDTPQKILQPEDGAELNANMKSMAVTLSAHKWNSVAFFETLVSFHDAEPVGDLRTQLEKMSKMSAELVFLGLLQVKGNWSDLHQEALTKLLFVFLVGHPNSSLILSRLWTLNGTMLVSGLREMYKKDANTLSRILDVAQDLKIITTLLSIESFNFTIDLAALASRREYLNLEKWLLDSIARHKDQFIAACLNFLKSKMNEEIARQTHNVASQSVPLSLEVNAIFLRVLERSTMTPANTDYFKEVRNTCLQVHPRLMNVGASAEELASGSETTFSSDVEAEVNGHYERIYRGDMSMDSVVELLTRLKNSPDPRQQQVFACMVHNLFDEYRFFPKYPDKELAITSVLFGSLIRYQLVSYTPFGIALRYVLDALRSSPGSRMFKFGVQALTQFQSRLAEWPPFCEHLLQIPHLRQFLPELAQFARSVTTAAHQQKQHQQLAQPPSHGHPPTSQQGSPPSLPQQQQQQGDGRGSLSHASSPAPPVRNVALVFNSVHVDYEDEEIVAPSEALQDRILFNINNLAENNLLSKLPELRETIEESVYAWFSQYLVVKRASLEPNQHELYLKMLDLLRKPDLLKCVLRQTLVNIRVLLNSEKTVDSSSERALLKNLGSWLGGMTLARNVPIRHKHIAFKDLLIEGYDSGRLIVAIPFVAKVLEQGKRSTVFRPPNPWLMGILRLLVELYHFADLKLNLKFEVEVLCNAFQIKVDDIEATTLLKDRPPKELLDPHAVAGAMDALNYGYPLQSANTGATSAATLQNTAAYDDLLNVGLPNLASFLHFDPSFTLFITQPVLKRIFHLAIDRAIREIIAPVVERSVTIAGISTRELIIKDFALEPNEEKMRKAAHSMVRSLAGNLALVTCKEPLRVNITNHVRTLMVQGNYHDQNLPEDLITVTVEDNLELACSIVEKAAADKAVPEIDEILAASFNNRRKYRERTGQPYYDMNAFSASRYPANLPDALRLKPTGLSAAQLRVYDEFAKSARPAGQARPLGAPSSDGSPLFTYGASDQLGATQPSSSSSLLPQQGSQPSQPIQPMLQQAQQGQQQSQQQDPYRQFIAELDAKISANADVPWQKLPVHHDINVLMRQISLLAGQSRQRDEVALTFSQKVVQLLYKNDTELSREVYVMLLEHLCKISVKVDKEVTAWLLYADDERKYNVPVTMALIKAGLINVAELDLQLAKLMEANRPAAVEFAAKLVRQCVFDTQQSCATRNQFANSLATLARIAQRTAVSETCLLEEIKMGPAQSDELSAVTMSGAVSAIGTGNTELASIRDQLVFVFGEWVRLYQHPSSNEKSLAVFVNQIQQQSILQDENTFSLFFRSCIELCVEIYQKQAATTGSSALAIYQTVDAYAKLIALLVRSHDEKNGVTQAAYLKKILSITVLVLVKEHEQRKQKFNQKPFFRLFVGLLMELNLSESSVLPEQRFAFLQAFSETFHTLRPSFLPGFTFAWVSLISHRLFMPKLLLAEDRKGWPVALKLQMDLFQFLYPFLERVEMKDSTRLLYKSALRILLVLLHDFPDFLSAYHLDFCDNIPVVCIQLRNLILSAFPRDIRLPDPFMRNLKVDLLPEVNQPPTVLSDYTAILADSGLKQDIDNYLKARAPVSFLLDLRSRLTLSATPGSPDQAAAAAVVRYNVPLINALVMYIGVQAVAHLHGKGQEGVSPITHSVPMDIFQQLLIDMDLEGRYLFVNAIANQLRYPNSHTHYFSCVLLYLFAEANQDIIKEQITRVLLERLIANRPHPWGLMITLIELMKNPCYKFWDHPFTRCAPDIERLFQSVARSINI